MKMMKGHNAQGHDVKSRDYQKPHTAGVGNERKADVKGVQEGGSAAEAKGNRISTVGHTHLKHAVHELHSQHPHHHGHHTHAGHKTSMETKDHHRHMPLHGMRPHHGK